MGEADILIRLQRLFFSGTPIQPLQFFYALFAPVPHLRPTNGPKNQDILQSEIIIDKFCQIKRYIIIKLQTHDLQYGIYKRDCCIHR